MTSVHVADVNWLLSALTQASAAMIAIVGGLLVTRYVALHAEQASAQRRVDDLKRRFETAQSQHAAARASFQSGEVNDILDDTEVFKATWEALSEGTTADVAAVLAIAERDGEGVDLELLAEQITALHKEIQSAVVNIEPLVPESTEQPSWSDFRRTNSISPARPEAWRWVYDEICEERIEAALATKRQANPYAMADMSALLAHRARSTTSAFDREERRSDHAWRRTAVDQTSSLMEQLSQEQRLAQENLDAARQPEGFSLAIRVLIALAVLGMIVPVTVMTYGDMYLHWGWRVAVSTLFFVGVGLLLRFLLVYADFLREGGRTSLPKNLRGLLRS